MSIETAKTASAHAVLVAAGVLVALLAAAPPAAACSCIEPEPAAVALANADAVFTGRVESVEFTIRETDYGKLSQRKVVFALDAVWKGLPEGDTVIVWTGTGGGDCGLPFVAGERYVVYGYGEGENGELSTNICTRTRPLLGSGADLAALGDPLRRVETKEKDAGAAKGEGPKKGSQGGR